MTESINMSRSGIATALIIVFLVVLGTLSAAPAGAATRGSLTQIGCVFNDNEFSPLFPDCTKGRTLDGATSVALSPDGKNAYVASYYSDAVAVFDRNPGTGALKQKNGQEGCIRETDLSDDCKDGRALKGASSVVVSPKGENVYVASAVSGAIDVFDRDPGTGALTQKAGTEGCISDDGTGGLCINGKALNYAMSVVVSPDGDSVYAASGGTDGITVFDRDTDRTDNKVGGLTQKADAEGCILQHRVPTTHNPWNGQWIDQNGNVLGQNGHVNGSRKTDDGYCTQDGEALDGATFVTVSPDNGNVYVSANISQAIAVFDRDTNRTDNKVGALTQKAGKEACISNNVSYINTNHCTEGGALNQPYSVAVSPEGNNVYVTATIDEGVAIFDRNAQGGLKQKAGEGCVVQSQLNYCRDGKALKGASSVALSPKGETVYVASSTSSAIAVFDRDTNSTDYGVGALAQKSTTEACISSRFWNKWGCAGGKEQLVGANFVTVSSDGKHAYVTSPLSDAVTVFDRKQQDDIAPTPALSRPGSKACNLRITSPGKVKTKGKSRRKVRILKKKRIKRLFKDGTKITVGWGRDENSKTVRCKDMKVILVQKRGAGKHTKLVVPGTKIRVRKKDLSTKRFARTVRRLKRRKVGILRVKNYPYESETRASFKPFKYHHSSLGKKALNNLRKRRYRGTFRLYVAVDMKDGTTVKKVVKKIELRAR